MSAQDNANRADIVPVIELGQRADSEIAGELNEVCESVGFFVISEHGVPRARINRMVATCQEYFQQGMSAKAVDAALDATRFRGYTSGWGYVDEEVVNAKEGFEVGLYDNELDMARAGCPVEYASAYPRNVWPKSIDGFECAWREYIDSMVELGDRLLRIAAHALGLPEDWFGSKFSHQSSMLAANYYPAQTKRPDRQAPRLHEHSDFGAFTILHQSTNVGGLEVLYADSWHEVPYIEDTFVVNLGDMIARWTNDRWIATRHRVRQPRPKEAAGERISIPFFQQPNLDAVIEVIPGCVPPGESARYAPMLWQEWERRRMMDLA